LRNAIVAVGFELISRERVLFSGEARAAPESRHVGTRG
jgi:hypothetical protein